MPVGLMLLLLTLLWGESPGVVRLLRLFPVRGAAGINHGFQQKARTWRVLMLMSSALCFIVPPEQRLACRPCVAWCCKGLVLVLVEK